MKLRRALTLGTAIVITLTAGVSTWVWANLYRASSAPEVELTIPQGLMGRDVLQLLRHDGLLPSELAGRLYLRFAAKDRSIRFGHYRIDAGSRPVDVLDLLLQGAVEMVSVTIVEGSDIGAVAVEMAAAGIGTETEWLAIADRARLDQRSVPGSDLARGVLLSGHLPVRRGDRGCDCRPPPG